MLKNMKLFNELSAKVFDSLIEVFPVEKNIGSKIFLNLTMQKQRSVLFNFSFFWKTKII
jgi:hypothetical protein